MLSVDEKPDILTTQEGQQVGWRTAGRGVMGLKLLMAKGGGRTQTRHRNVKESCTHWVSLNR